MNGLARLWAFSTVPVAQVFRQERVRCNRETTFVLVSPMTSPTIETSCGSTLWPESTRSSCRLAKRSDAPLPGVRRWEIDLPATEAAA